MCLAADCPEPLPASASLHCTVPYRTVQYALMDQIQIDLHITIEQTTARTHDVCTCDDQRIWEVCRMPYTRHCIKRQVWWAIREGSAWTACTIRYDTIRHDILTRWLALCQVGGGDRTDITAERSASHAVRLLLDRRVVPNGKRVNLTGLN